MNYRLAPWIAYALFGLINECVAQPNNDSHESIQYFSGAYTQWMERAQFACNFDFQLMRVQSPDGSLDKATVKEIVRHELGFLAKRDTDYRIRTSKESGSVLDFIENNSLRLTVVEPSTDTTDLLPGAKKTQVSANKAVSLSPVTLPSWGQSDNTCELSPIHLFSSRDPFQFESSARLNDDMTYDVTTSEGGNTLASVKASGTWNGTSHNMTCTVEFVIKGSLPLVAHKTFTVTSLTGDRIREIQWRLDTFVKSGQSELPQRVLRSTWDKEYGKGESQDVWYIAHWHSDDLGSRLPVDDDFALQIPENAKFVGMPQSSEKWAGRKTRLNDLSIRDTFQPGSIISDGKVVGNIYDDSNANGRGMIPKERHGTSVPLILTISCLAILAGSILIKRIRRTDSF